MKTLREALRSEELALTAELALGPRDGPEAILEQARTFAAQCDAVQVPDHRHYRPHISNLAVSAMLAREGIDPIMQMNCRDRNRVATQSDIIGARALGVSNFLLMRGAAYPPDHRPKTSSVFDVGAIDLIATAATIREGDAFPGTAPEGASELYLGTVATAFNPSDGWAPEKLTSKADAGAQFIQLQLCHDIELMRAYAARIVQSKLTWRLRILAGLAVLPSAEEARALRQSRPDSAIPSDVVQRIDGAADPQAEGVAIAAEQLQEIAAIPGISGVTLVTPGDPALVPAAIEASGLRQ